MHRWLAVMLLFSGCAFGLSGPDPDRPRSKMPKCDTGKGMVVLDGVMAATAGIVAISLAGDTEPAVALLPMSIGAIYAAGALRGNNNVNKCRAAMAEYESYAAVQGTMPPPRDEIPLDDEPVPRAPAVTAQANTPRQPLATPVAAPPAAPPLATPASPLPPPAAPAARTTAPSAPPVATAPAKPVPARPAPGKQAPAKQTGDDEWSDFWREVEP